MVPEAFVDDVVVPGPAVLVAKGSVLVHAEESQVVQPLHLLLGVDDHTATVDRGQHLDRVEAEAGDVAEASDLPSAADGAERMAVVLDHAQAVLLREPVDTVEVARDAGEAERDDRLGAIVDQLLGLFDVDAHVGFADVTHGHVGAAHPHRLVVGHIVEGRSDDLVARSHAGDQQRDVKGRGACVGGHDPAVGELEIGGDPIFELLRERAHAEPAHVEGVGQVLQRVDADVRNEDRDASRFGQLSPSRTEEIPPGRS